jgi:hypothetical protein
MKAIISMSSAPLPFSTAVLNAIRPIENKSGLSESPELLNADKGKSFA